MKTSLLCKLCVWIVCLFITQSVFAQQVSIKGTVLSGTDNFPVIGASVIQKGTTNGTITDIDGNFSIDVPQGTTISISYIGFITQEFPANASKTLEVILIEDVQALSDVIVTGYSSQKKADLTGAVSVVKMEEIKTINTSNAMQSLQGRVPGVHITNTGNPTGDVDVKVRGVSTLGNSRPLYIIDGVPSTRSMNEIATSDIESIQVLKDASAASIYGSRAANGVIIVTTKKGKTGGTNVEFRASLTASQWQRSVDLLNAEQRGQAQWLAAMTDKTDPNYGNYEFDWQTNANGHAVLDKVILPQYLYVGGVATMEATDTDWVKEISRTGFIQNYNVTVTNGNEKGRALFSVDYYGNQGTIKSSYFNRIVARINSDYKLFNDRLTIGENFSLSKTRESALDAANLQDRARLIQPLVPVYDMEGGWGGPASNMSDRQNPVRMIEDNKDNYKDVVRLFGDVSLDLEIIKGLNFRSKLGIDYTAYWQRHMQKSYQSGFLSDETARLDTHSNYGGNWILSNTLNYKFDLGKHNFDILVGQEMLKYRFENMSAGRDGYVLETPDYMYLDAGEVNFRNNGSATSYALSSFFGKINYVFDNKYLASFTLRRDGSSRFGENHRWGTFPAFSLGWRISEEGFFEGVKNVFSDLKLRYGWGMTGNQEIDNYAAYGLYQARYYTDPTWERDQGTAYDIYGNNQGILPSGFIRTQRPNANLKWEATTQHNAGIDFGLLDQKFVGSVDYFLKKTDDILVKPPYIATIGFGGDSYVNGASMENWGLEFALTYNQKIGEVDLSVTGNIASYRNKITKLPEDVINSYPGNGNDQTILGRPWKSLFGYVTDGLFQTQEEVDAHADQPGKGLGRIRYKDLNDDKKITDEDRTWLGVEDPDFLYGLNVAASWRNFDFSMFWNGQVGSYTYNWLKEFTDFYGFFGGQNYGTRLLDGWRPDNTNTSIPAVSGSDVNNEIRTSDYFVENTSFLKLANFEIGYRLPENWLRGVRIQNARIYLSGQNLLTIKKGWGKDAFTGVDPETPRFAYPVPRSFTFGLNVSF
ncbi:TonB-linked SusC/RagA family outer membrane protein [Parabacteroides sp. PF5-5]|uniref:SusC/RagA family TonB-linked outer membrane protein n=1 Tax=unclassified Parabacteroides TaxID=2649774 RepID=UPI0024735E93|nr:MULTISPECIES: TonB-dependent receptor [unclassified Parabacteroides]MDH6306772.1 TonB-linked SusC/RagA family outer membrane protein [Parabacteroides sp. PH5-39]MDH6317658.1 TonB-linked SusC/RagA family outer membrane protein [Parabacteroides sp. PF5-13]MDH6321484.1 TonB-linked SusC/RagA family outer membrane protein [Parabacteroides sp. PH5-13]MDH6325239.1 TonB-linked SusC/RagA family outer membrane protein [Parabacteroides sp. PH5-8]MDH6328843.1 TonB-linked SusC/RagA family outer membrane